MSVLFWGGGAKGLEVTSPRLRGEVGAKRRVRGTLRESVCHRFRGSSPSPQPSPRKNGARGTRELPKSRATVSLCDAFPVGFKLRNELRTNRGRIGDSPLSPVPFTQDVAGGLLGLH